MDWELAIEKNQAALKRVLATLVAMTGMGESERASSSSASSLPATLPRHLHRFVLRLLRPAEAATRRLIIIAARGLVVKLPKIYPPKPRPKKPPLNRKNGYGTGLVIRPGPLPEWVKALVPKRSPRLSLPLLDPMKRFSVRRKYAKRSAMPQIRLLGDDGPIVPFFRRPEPLPPPPPTPDDPMDAGSIHRRLDVLSRVLDDLPKQALRMASWQARRDARLAAERADTGYAEASQVENSPSPSLPFAPSPSRASPSPPLPHSMGARNGGGTDGAPAWHPFLAPMEWGRGGEPLSPELVEGVKERNGERVKERDGEGIDWEELGVTPEALALLRRRNRRHTQPSASAQTPKPRRFHRTSPMRPGRPPGWRRKPNHDVYEVLNELHGFAVWASERRDSS